MAIFALSDLHLALSDPDKSMDVFGSGWENYMDRMKENCLRMVGEDDTILMPGDLSWVMYLEDGDKDFGYIDSLPGRKLIGRGNHDYFWTTVRKMENYFADKGFNSIEIVKNNAVEVEDSLVTGTRGWKLPSDDNFGEDDRKVWDREMIRLKLCLEALDKADPEHAKRHILMLHYPPLSVRSGSTPMTDLIEAHKVDICIYGHLHGRSHAKAFEGERGEGGTKYMCVSADYRKFEPVKL